MPGKPVRFARENFFPRDWKLCTDEFLSLFHRFGYIYKPLQGGSWLSANDQWKLSDTEILKAAACAHPKFFLGSRSGKLSRFAVFDIDANSKYHNDQSLQKIRAALAAGGIARTVVYRSSNSGGWHLYIFFDEAIKCSDLRHQLVTLLELNDFDIAKGTLEIFPSPGEGSLGQGLRLPLQPGWAFLDQTTLEVEYDRAQLSATKALEFFIDDLTGDTNTYANFRALRLYVGDLATRKEIVKKVAAKSNVYDFPRREQTSNNTAQVKDIFGVLPPGINADTWWRGRSFFDQGLSGPSQRAEAIFCLSHYLFYGDPERGLDAQGYGCHQEREWAINEILSAKHNGQSKDLTRGRADALSQVERAARWLPPHKRDSKPEKYTPQVPVRWVRYNANQSQDAQKRIRKSVEEFQSTGTGFSMRDLMAAAKCSQHTLQKYGELWRPAQAKLRGDRLESVAVEYNAVVGVVSPENHPPATALKKDMPPGRLAARRIIYEMNSRSERARLQLQKAATSSVNASESSWQGNVTWLTGNTPSSLPISELKALLSVLLKYLAVAPSYEDQLSLTPFIQEVRSELSSRQTGPIHLNHAVCNSS